MQGKIILSCVFVFMVMLAFRQPENANPIRPNILFVIADDASWASFGAYGCEWIKTPAFDRVAKEGILFSNAYTPNAKCAPSRACVLTGRNSWQLEEAGNHSAYFPAKFKTYAEALGEQGYFTGSVAKGWLPGNAGKINGKPRELTGKKYNEIRTTAPTTGISDVDYAANFEVFLNEKPKDQPFCFWFGSHEPHRSYEFGSGRNKGGLQPGNIKSVPSFWPDVDTVRTDMLDYGYEVEHFDQHLQKMLNLLEEKGELDNTIIVVTSDNGMPFPRIKGNQYEYASHMPLAIMWPKGIKRPGRVVNDYVSFIDLAPTFLELAGISAAKAGMQPITGKSLTDILFSDKSGTVNPNRNYTLIGQERHDVGRPNDEGYPIRGIVKDGYMYLRNYKTDRWPMGNPETGYLNTDGSPTKTFILNTRRQHGNWYFWQLNFGKRYAEELYDIQNDPYCMSNLAADKKHAPLKEKLNSFMVQKLLEQKDPRMLGNGDVFDKYEYAGDVKNFYNRFMSGEKVNAGWVNKTDFDADLQDKKTEPNQQK
ncbi:sulfatase family protein [Lacibacter sp. H407]|uniref:sulfatase family protein n=1 Tax=Lacibacter sp. H407 TaxID=3133423 RepID=UPI0030BC1E32